MKVVLINKSDTVGGAAVVTRRLAHALRGAGIDASMLVLDKQTSYPWVHVAASPRRARIPFLAERGEIFLQNGRNRSLLFKADTATFGLPLWKHPLVSEADVVCLGWVNQGMLSLRGVERISALGKPIVWTCHDMWPCTGICHHAGECEGFLSECGLCPLLGRRASSRDLSRRVWRRKQAMNAAARPVYVAVSDWLLGRFKASRLLGRERTLCIPNPFDMTRWPYAPASKGEEKVEVLMAAARLDDPIKGPDLLVRACRILARDYASLASRLRLRLAGTVKNPASLAGIPLEHEFLGTLPMERLKGEYARAHVVVSSSRYETLPGTLIEGQAMGALPVAFDRGGASTIISDPLLGVLAPWTDDPAASLAAALAKAAKVVLSTPWRPLQTRLRRSVEAKFAAPAVAARYINLFNSLMDESQRT